MPSPTVEDEIMPGFDDGSRSPTPVADADDAWPSIAWEKALLEKANHPCAAAGRSISSSRTTPNISFEESPHGASLWDAWDDPDADAGDALRLAAADRRGAARAAHRPARSSKALGPTIVVIGDAGAAALHRSGDLLAVAVPPNAADRGDAVHGPGVDPGARQRRRPRRPLQLRRHALFARISASSRWRRRTSRRQFMPHAVHRALSRRPSARSCG